MKFDVNSKSQLGFGKVSVSLEPHVFYFDSNGGPRLPVFSTFESVVSFCIAHVSKLISVLSMDLNQLDVHFWRFRKTTLVLL